MAVEIHTELVPIEQLTDPRQRFACRPLRAELEAGFCVLRQQGVARDLAAQRSSAHGKATGVVPRHRECLDCADGRAVAARVSIDRAPPASPTELAQRRARGGAGRSKTCSQCGTPGHNAVTCGRAPLRPGPQPAPHAAAPAPQEATVLRDGKSETKADASPKAAPPKPATCNHPRGCTRPVARVVATTRTEERGWCRQCRNAAQKKRTPSARAKVGGTKRAAGKAPAPTRSKRPAPRKPARVVDLDFATVLDPVRERLEQAQRAVAVVARLGGIAKAEALADAIGGA